MDSTLIIEIYADIIFLINLVVNAAILRIATILRRKSARLWRTALAAATAAALYAIAIFTPIAPFVSVLTSFVILAPAIPIAMPIRGRADFALSLLAAYISAFAVAGVAMATVHIFNIGGGWGIGTYAFAMNNFTPLNLASAIIVSFVVLKFAQERIFKKAITAQGFCCFRVHMDGKMVELTALIDTGNGLIDPISRHPVIVAEFDKIKPLLPESVVKLYAQAKQDDLAAIADCFSQGGMATRIRMIPFCAIGKSGVIAGFRPDKIEVERGKASVRSAQATATVDAIIGICDFALSADGEYHALMNPMI